MGVVFGGGGVVGARGYGAGVRVGLREYKHPVHQHE